MLTILPCPDHVAGFAISGTLTTDDFARLAAEIDGKLKRHDRIGVVVDLTGFEDVTFKAALEDLRYNLGKLGEWKRFPREAIVTDKQWIRTMVDLAGGFIPFVTVKVFEPGAQQAALDWAAEIKQPASA
jgi:hypothetical protein